MQYGITTNVADWRDSVPIRTLLILFAFWVIPRPQIISIPDTPAGAAFQAWLEAFNAADAARLEAYAAKYRKGLTGSVVFVKHGPPVKPDGWLYESETFLAWLIHQRRES
jgi:hypothetical protein